MLWDSALWTGNNAVVLDYIIHILLFWTAMKREVINILTIEVWLVGVQFEVKAAQTLQTASACLCHVVNDAKGYLKCYLSNYAVEIERYQWKSSWKVHLEKHWRWLLMIGRFQSKIANCGRYWHNSLIRYGNDHNDQRKENILSLTSFILLVWSIVVCNCNVDVYFFWRFFALYLAVQNAKKSI